MKSKIRCAIYTRKSSEEGLELEFNSLQAQREACEAYIKSQKHENWHLLSTKYDDGGYSGGTLNRPALQQLLSDIKAGLIDIIVVYKIDRLTRSLMDFSKIVEVLDKHNASFVSITQHFNTTTSMGRLTLNMLLSFAQFEREVTGERIRDKIAASKKKGMWMGGKPPLGYYRKDKKIYPDEEKVKLVNSIFKKYVELKSTTLVKEWLNKQGHPISVGNLNCILRNKAYIGFVGHKGTWYLGEHQGIISIGLFDQAQAVMSSNRINRQHYNHSKSLLAGKLYDDKGNVMNPSWSTGSQGKKYRYYVSQAVIKKDPSKIGQISKISLTKLEEFIDNWFAQFIRDKAKIYPYLKGFDIAKQKGIINKLTSYTITRDTEQALIKRVDISRRHIKITIYEEQVTELLNALYENRDMNLLQSEREHPYTEDYHIGIIDNGAKAIVGERIEKNTNKTLVQLLIQAFNISHDILQGKQVKDLCEKYQLTDRYMRKILTLRFLPAKVILSILDGTQGREITAKQLFEQASQHK